MNVPDLTELIYLYEVYELSLKYVHSIRRFELICTKTVNIQAYQQIYWQQLEYFLRYFGSLITDS